MSNEGNPIDAKASAAVGPEGLAMLLAEAAMTNLCMRRRLQFELSAQKGENVPDAVLQWISEFGAQTSFLDAEQVGELAEELDAMRVTIASNVSRAAPDLALDLMWQLFTLAGTIFERTTEEGWEISCVFDEACSDLVTVSVDAEVEPMEFATKVVAAITSGQYGEYRALIRAIASAQPWAPAYVSDLKVLLHRLLEEPPDPNSERSRDLRRALQELDSLSPT
ncbi:hypothetical protein GCT13_36800 [Paraburkholderia sp. CNPSo 3157]|uniref:Uncharacterized protein n=1 Tax=Paraburkholderia franconis TaxID=2654983 RepID=A0A7X1TK12_9BURK|nr:DUF6880 family protein [Paraburkholderia franconis]MPW22242.1 hypothetical protein [Paraburkholderia franconis]